LPFLLIFIFPPGNSIPSCAPETSAKKSGNKNGGLSPAAFVSIDARVTFAKMRFAHLPAHDDLNLVIQKTPQLP